MLYVDLSAKNVDRLIDGFDQYISAMEELEGGDHVGRAGLLGQALSTVLAMKLRSLTDPANEQLRERQANFFSRVRAALRRERPALAAWLAGLDIEIWRRTRDGWYGACLGRSVAQVIVDDIDDGAERALIAPHILEEMDAEMREIGPSIHALPPDVIPQGVPKTHWWWFIPSGPMQGDSEGDEPY